MAFVEFTPRALALVALGGALGALARFGVSAWLTRGAFPWGTLAVNVTGSFLLGFFLFGTAARGGFAGTADARLLLGVGFLGAYTTMSTFTFETVAYLEQGAYARAGANFLANPVLSLAGALLGRAAAYALPAAAGA